MYTFDVTQHKLNVRTYNQTCTPLLFKEKEVLGTIEMCRAKGYRCYWCFFICIFTLSKAQEKQSAFAGILINTSGVN